MKLVMDDEVTKDPEVRCKRNRGQQEPYPERI